MKLRIPAVSEEDKFDLIMNIVSFIPPFNSLRRRDKQVLTGLYYANHKYSAVPENKRNVIIFDYDTRMEIADKYGMSISTIYVCMMRLRKKGIITADTLVKKYIIHDTDQIIFNLSTNE